MTTTIAPPMTLMAMDMAEQAATLRRLMAKRMEVRTELLSRRREPLRGIALVGRGSSEHAARVGGVLLETCTELPVLLVRPSMVRLYGTHAPVDGYLAIGLSQSGRSVEIVETLKWLRTDGALTLAVTAHPDSPVAGVADLVLDLETGSERAVPATKSFTAELAAMAIVSEILGRASWGDVAWESMVGAVEWALEDRDPVRRCAGRLDGVEHLSVVGAGVGVGLAHEAALKIMEASGVAASAFSCESFRHGPMTLAGVRHPVIGIAVPGPARDEVLRLCASLEGVPTVVVADGPGADIRVPGHLPEALGAIPAAVRAQQVALELALRRGRDPDRPPGLEKVVVA